MLNLDEFTFRDILIQHDEEGKFPDRFCFMYFAPKSLMKDVKDDNIVLLAMSFTETSWECKLLEAHETVVGPAQTNVEFIRDEPCTIEVEDMVGLFKKYEVAAIEQAKRVSEQSNTGDA